MRICKLNIHYVKGKFFAVTRVCESKVFCSNAHTLFPADPIQLFTNTGTPIPSISCPDSLCTGKSNGNYRHPDNPRYFVTCENQLAKGCQRCADGLYFNWQCNQCRSQEDMDSIVCDYYTGSTTANNVCGVEDKAYGKRCYRIVGYYSEHYLYAYLAIAFVRCCASLAFL